MIQDLNGIGIQFSQIVEQINSLNNNKKQFSKSINYQIKSLFQLICPFSTASFSQLSISLGSLAAEVLIKNKKCFTPENLCDYLGVGQQSLKKNLWIQNKLNQQIKEQFKKLIFAQIDIIKRLRNYIKKVDIGKLFDQIDFFGNGYIDSTSLSEFVSHYNSKEQGNIQKQCLQIIRFFKDSATASKIFFQDFYNFIQSSKCKGNEIDNSQIDKNRKRSNNFGSQKRTIGHIAKTSEWSNLNMSVKTQNMQNKIHFHNNTISEVKCILSQQDLRDVDYETKLINAHPRNKKYIQRVKKQLQVNYLGQYGFCSNNKKLISPLQKTELIFKLKGISEIYYKRYQQIRNFMIENEKFTFLNGFNVIDQKQVQKVREAQFYDFISDQKINVQHKKVQLFFQRYSNENILKYHNYVQIFFMNIFNRKQFNKWMNRKPMLGQKWSLKMKNNYCKLFRKLINLIYQQKQAIFNFKNTIIQISKDIDYQYILITMFEDSKIHKDKMINILGQKAQPFILQLYGQNTLLQTYKFIQFFK